MRSRTSLHIVFALAYVLVWTALIQFVAFPRVHNMWAGAGIQIAAYLVLALPFIVARPRLLKLFRAPRGQYVLGAGLIVLALAYATAFDHQSAMRLGNNFLRQIVTGPIEELIFRGYLWEQTLRLTRNPVALIVSNIVFFAILHIPYVIAQHVSWTFFIGVGIFGLVMALLRLKTGNIALSSLVHAAVNLS